MSVTLKPSNTFSRQKVVVPGESLYTVDFGEMQPNFYRINNMDDVTLYCATNSLPSQKLYDFKVNPYAVANYTEPKYSNKLYIYNPVQKDVNVIINFWQDEFDPTFMAVGEISLNNEGVVETDGIIKGFTTELPAGDNKLGSVDVILSDEFEYVIDGIRTNQQECSSKLSNVIKTLQTDGVKVILSDITDTSIESAITLGNTYQNQIRNHLTQTLYPDIQQIISLLSNSQKTISPVRITDNTNTGYVMDESWVQCNTDGLEYIGEILTCKDLITITTIRATVTGDVDVEGFTVEDWNNVCHIIKAHTVSFTDKNGNTTQPKFAVYNM